MYSDIQPIKMTNKARKAAKWLTVAYGAYTEAMALKDPEGVALWGDILARRQRECGVEIIGHDNLERLVAAANRGTLFRL